MSDIDADKTSENKTSNFLSKTIKTREIAALLVLTD